MVVVERKQYKCGGGGGKQYKCGGGGGKQYKCGGGGGGGKTIELRRRE